MKLLIKQKLFRLTDNFTVYGENDKIEYLVKGKLISATKKLNIMDANKNLVAMFRKKVFALVRTYFIFEEKIKVGKIKKKIFSLFVKKYKIVYKGNEYKLNGSIFDYDYDVKKGNEIVVSCHKKFFKIADTYVIDYVSDEYKLLAMFITMAIDVEKATDRKNKQNTKK